MTNDDISGRGADGRAEAGGTSAERPGRDGRHRTFGGVVGRAIPLLGAAVLGAVASIVVLGLGPPTKGRLGPGEVELRARAATEGRTRLGLPPSAPSPPQPTTLRCS